MDNNRKYWFFGSKLNTVLLLILIILMVIALRIMNHTKELYLGVLGLAPKNSEVVVPNQKGTASMPESTTYTYSAHGFSIELPKGFIPHEEEAEGGPYTSISLPGQYNFIQYIHDMKWWDQYDATEYTFIKNETIGKNTFQKYAFVDSANTSLPKSLYLYRKGNIGYFFVLNSYDEKLLQSFSYIGWSK